MTDKARTAVMVGAEVPLSASQRRLWFLSQYDDHDAYVIARATRFSGPLDISALRTAHQLVGDRHEILRTSFVNRSGVATALVEPPGRPIDFTVEEVADPEHGTASQQSVDEFLASAVRTPFNLATGPIWRIRVGRFAPDDHIVVTVVHHVAADGWSFPVLRDEVSTAYRAIVTGAEPDLASLTTQYRDHARAEQAVEAKSIEYWAERFGHDPDPIPLLGDRPRPHRRSQEGGWAEVGPLEATGSRIRDIASRCGGSAFMVGLAIFSNFLARISRTDEVIVGIPHADRGDTAAHGLIGPFVNTLPLRIEVPGGASLVDQVGIVRSEMLKALDHASVPFEDIVKAANPRRDPSHTPLFQAMYQYHDGAFRSGYDLPGLTEQNIPVDGATSKFDLLFEMSGVDGPLSGSLNFSADIFEKETAHGLARALAVMTEAALATPDTPLDQLPLLDRWEHHWIVDELNATRRHYPKTARLWDLFEDSARGRRDDPAIREGDRTLSYGELRERSMAIAERLRAVGIGSGDGVGLEMERSADLVAAMLAVVSVGAAYVPLDPSYPRVRLDQMIHQSGLRYVLRSGSPESGGLDLAPTGHVESATIDPDAAYIMFTSGSTGNPKGTVIPHQAVARLVCNPDYIDLGPGDVVAHLSNTSFDAATFEVWGALLNGAILQVIDPATVIDPDGLTAAFAEFEISTVFVTTALFNLIARHEPAAFAGIRDVLFGGERCSVDAVAAVMAAGPPSRLVHVYGPTESTTFASWHLVSEDDILAGTVPIGGPVANTTVYVVDRAGEPLPPGMVGELWIGGDGLALEYLGEPALTAERFGPDRFGDDPWGRLYRTGDLVRRRRDGAIEFVGRIDRQIKLRGFRIEPEEVERALRSHPDVADALVAVVQSGEHSRLASWVVPAAGRTTDAAALMDHLRGILPAYTVPASIVSIEAIPIAPSGKVDMTVLPSPVEQVRPKSGPITASTAVMIEAFESALGIDGVGPGDSFFDLGGHSLLAVELVAVAESLTGYRLPLAALFDDPTPAGLARSIDESRGDDTDGVVTFVQGGTGTPVFLFHHPSGTVLAYEPLARRIGDRRAIYGIQARGIDGGDRPVKSINAMAEEYANRIERTNPEGSCVLAGHSLGGLLAWETARVLRQRGRDVALLALFDSRIPHRGWVDVDGETLKLTRFGLLKRRLRIWGGNIYYGARYGSFALRKSAIPPDLARIRQIRASSRAFETYRPAPLDQHVVFFAARGSGRGRSSVPDGRPSEHDWQDLARSIEVVKVPGTHTGEDSLLAEPNVEVLAGELRTRIDAATSRPVATEQPPPDTPDHVHTGPASSYVENFSEGTEKTV